MKARIKRFDKELPLPEYKTRGASGFDLVAREAAVILPGKSGYVPLNVAIQVPEGYFVLLTARSSLHKKGLVPINGVGIIDRDYSGDGDEYIAALFNFTEHEVIVLKGDRIMQGVLLSSTQVEFEEVEQLENASRGGFGSTGQR